MIILNEDDVIKLNKYKIGISMDNMQSFIIDYNIAKNICDVSQYDGAYNTCKNILEATKFNMSEDIDNFGAVKELQKSADDKLLEDIELNNEVAYGTQSDEWLQYKKSFGLESSDMIYIGDMVGIPVEVIYKYGFIYRAYIIGRDNKRYKDITYICKEYCNNKINQLIPFKYAHVIGKLRTKGNIQKYHGYTELNIIHYIRLKTHPERIELVIEAVDGIEGHNLWDIMEYINQEDIHIAPHFLVRNIDSDTLNESIKAIVDEFNQIDNIWDSCYGIRVYKMNNKKNIIYNGNYGNKQRIYESIITGFSPKVNEELIIRINKVKCNDNLSISTVICDDLLKIDKNLHIGDKISFYIIGANAYIYTDSNLKEKDNNENIEFIDY